MEVDPVYLRAGGRHPSESAVVSFMGPFVVASLASYFLLELDGARSLIAGYRASHDFAGGGLRVLVERGLTRTRAYGKLLMSATFVTDM